MLLIPNILKFEFKCAPTLAKVINTHVRDLVFVQGRTQVTSFWQTLKRLPRHWRASWLLCWTTLMERQLKIWSDLKRLFFQRLYCTGFEGQCLQCELPIFVASLYCSSASLFLSELVTVKKYCMRKWATFHKRNKVLLNLHDDCMVKVLLQVGTYLLVLLGCLRLYLYSG